MKRCRQIRERKTVISGDSDDFRALAAASGADGEAPFLALAKVASTNASSRFSFPRSCRWPAKSLSACPNLPLRTHCWTGDGSSGTAGTSRASHATAPRFPTPRARRSALSGYRATGGHAYPPAALAAAPAQRRPIVHRSVPKVLSRRFAGPEQTQDRTNSPTSYL